MNLASILLIAAAATTLHAGQPSASCQAEELSRIQSEMEVQNSELRSTQQGSDPSDRIKGYALTASLLRKFSRYETCEAEGAASMLKQIESLRNRAVTGGATRVSAEAGAHQLQSLLGEVRRKIEQQMKAGNQDLENTVNQYEEIAAVNDALTNTLREDAQNRRPPKDALAEVEVSASTLGLMEWAFRKKAHLAESLALIYESRADRLERTTGRAQVLAEVESVLETTKRDTQAPGPEASIADWGLLQQSFQPSAGSKDVKQLRDAAKRLIKKGVRK